MILEPLDQLPCRVERAQHRLPMRIGITLCIDPPAEGVGCVPVGRGGDAVVSTCMRHTSIRQLRASGVYLWGEGATPW